MKILSRSASITPRKRELPMGSKPFWAAKLPPSCKTRPQCKRQSGMRLQRLRNRGGAKNWKLRLSMFFAAKIRRMGPRTATTHQPPIRKPDNPNMVQKRTTNPCWLWKRQTMPAWALQISTQSCWHGLTRILAEWNGLTLICYVMIFKWVSAKKNLRLFDWQYFCLELKMVSLCKAITQATLW